MHTVGSEEQDRMNSQACTSASESHADSPAFTSASVSHEEPGGESHVRQCVDKIETQVRKCKNID